ncbi:MAG: 3-phosphoglycerate dehydrogenase family protein [Anaerotardibacter sp.]
MNRIHCLNNISKLGTDLLPDTYELTDEINDATGILVRSAAMHDTEFSDNLLAIARAGAGVNNIPLDRCAQEGIVVFNTPGANANAVKELVLCGMLLGSRGIIDGANWCTENAQDENIAKTVEKAKKNFAGNEIMGKKLGVIGLGAIGALVSEAALALGMEVYGYDPYVSVNAAWRLPNQVKQVTELKEICASCDYLTIHVPALPSTKGMIGAEEMAVMDGAVVLNFSRDTLVDTPAMAAALEQGNVARYITDFATPEVMQLKNTIVLPHLGASTAEAEDNCAIMAVREIVDYIDNGNITNSVNFPGCNAGAKAGASRVTICSANNSEIAAQATAALAAFGLAKMANETRGDYGYTIIDTNEAVSAEALEAVKALEGVTRVRAL